MEVDRSTHTCMERVVPLYSRGAYSTHFLWLPYSWEADIIIHYQYYKLSYSGT